MLSSQYYCCCYYFYLLGCFSFHWAFKLFIRTVWLPSLARTYMKYVHTKAWNRQFHSRGFIAQEAFLHRCAGAVVLLRRCKGRCFISFCQIFLPYNYKNSYFTCFYYIEIYEIYKFYYATRFLILSNIERHEKN